MLGYHLDQRSADLEMARKVGRPNEVLVQDFIPDDHMNLLNQVHALGQTVDGECVKVNIGSEDAPQWINVIPIYAVSSEFLPLSNAILNAERGAPVRPMPRTAADDLRRHRLEIESISARALAFVIEEAPATAAGVIETGPFEVLAEQGSARLVEIAGAVVTGNGLRDRVSDALLAAGVISVPESLMIAPAALTATPQPSTALLQGLRWWLSFLGALFALLALMAPRASELLVGFAKKPTPVQRVEAHGTFPEIGLFQPIASQDELSLDEEHKLSEDNAATLIRRRISRLTDFASSSLSGVRSPR